MSLTRRRTLAVSALLLIGSAALTGCAAGIDTDDTGSVAVVEKFLKHLEAGEATAAAALTDLDFADELIDDDFYAASAALPTDARIVKTSGYDDFGFSATVEFVLDDASAPESLDLTVRENDGVFTIVRWSSYLPVRIGPYPAHGVVRVNNTLDYTLAKAGNDLTLLPAAYALEYTDPTGLLRLGAEDDTSFTVNSPNRGEGFSIVPSFLPDVEPSITTEIERLQNACAAEGFTGPSCPPGLVDAVTASPGAATSSGEWFRDSGIDIRMKGDGYEATSSYTFRNDELPDLITVSYTGTVTRGASGAVVFAR